MFANLLEKLKNPVTTVIEKSQEEDLKKSGIKLAIISVVMALISTISSVISIFAKYSKKSYWYSYYSSSELSKLRWDAIKDAELFTGFLKTAVISAIVIAVIALILFIIAKIIKSPKEYKSNLSMVNNTAIVYATGSVLKLILSLIYAPLGLIVWYACTVYASFTLINAYRDSLEVETTDTLVLAVTGVFSVIVVILAIVLSSILKVSLGSITDLFSLLNV